MTKSVFTTVVEFVTDKHGVFETYHADSIPLPRVGDTVEAGGRQYVTGIVEKIVYSYPDPYGPEPTIVYIRVYIKS